MKLVIDIPNKIYEFVKDRGHLPYAVSLANAIENGVPYEERLKGHWVISKDGTYPICNLCSTRGETQYDGLEPIPKCTSFCPNCGADMRGDNQCQKK